MLTIRKQEMPFCWAIHPNRPPPFRNHYYCGCLSAFLLHCQPHFHTYTYSVFSNSSYSDSFVLEYDCKWAIVGKVAIIKHTLFSMMKLEYIKRKTRDTYTYTWSFNLNYFNWCISLCAQLGFKMLPQNIRKINVKQICCIDFTAIKFETIVWHLLSRAWYMSQSI